MTTREPSERLASLVRRVLKRHRYLSSVGGRRGWRVEPMQHERVLITALNYAGDVEARSHDMERWSDALSAAGLRVQRTAWDDEMEVRFPLP